MMMQGMHLMGEAPWPRLYLHGLVRAADGAKMSKSKGNVVDPLGLIDQYGADALRFFMAAMESQGRDVKMDEKRVEGYRNFATKLWNAARFCEANGIGASRQVAAPARDQRGQPLDHRRNRGERSRALDEAMAALRFDAAANTIYQFVWDRFLRLVSRTDQGADGCTRPRPSPAGCSTRSSSCCTPSCPSSPKSCGPSWATAQHYPLITARWPDPQAAIDPAAKAEVDWLIALTTALRGAKNELGLAPGAKLEAFLAAAQRHGEAGDRRQPRRARPRGAAVFGHASRMPPRARPCRSRRVRTPSSSRSKG